MTDYPYSLLCFSNNESVLYPENFGACWLTPTQEVISNQSITIQPNPVQDKLIITNSSQQNETNTISIYSLQGILLEQKITTINQTEIDVSFLNQGIYFIIIENKNGDSFYQKFIKI